MNQNKISETILNIRKTHKLTQKDLADELHVTYQAVSKWETGKSIPDIEILKTICNKYNIDINELLDNKVESKNKTSKNNKLIYIILVIILLIVILLIVYFYNRNNKFKLSGVVGTCDSFNVSGSIAYNSDYTSIYLNNFSYCGSSTDLYSDFNALMYIVNNNVETIIGSTSLDGTHTLDEFSKNLSFRVDSNTRTLINKSSIKLVIRAKNSNNEIVEFTMPITLSE